jgi:hypothetical protein
METSKKVWFAVEAVGWLLIVLQVSLWGRPHSIYLNGTTDVIGGIQTGAILTGLAAGIALFWGHNWRRRILAIILLIVSLLAPFGLLFI